jgi:hypothetical protein
VIIKLAKIAENCDHNMDPPGLKFGPLGVNVNYSHGANLTPGVDVRITSYSNFSDFPIFYDQYYYYYSSIMRQILSPKSPMLAPQKPIK